MREYGLLLLASTLMCSAVTYPVTAASSQIPADIVDRQDLSASVAKSQGTGQMAKPEKSEIFGTKIPEPSNFMMLGLGIAGLVAGRWAARHRRKNSPD